MEAPIIFSWSKLCLFPIIMKQGCSIFWRVSFFAARSSVTLWTRTQCIFRISGVAFFYLGGQANAWKCTNELAVSQWALLQDIPEFWQRSVESRILEKQTTRFLASVGTIMVHFCSNSTPSIVRLRGNIVMLIPWFSLPFEQWGQVWRELGWPKRRKFFIVCLWLEAAMHGLAFNSYLPSNAGGTDKG